MLSGLLGIPLGPDAMTAGLAALDRMFGLDRRRASMRGLFISENPQILTASLSIDRLSARAGGAPATSKSVASKMTVRRRVTILGTQKRSTKVCSVVG